MKRIIVMVAFTVLVLTGCAPQVINTKGSLAVSLFANPGAACTGAGGYEDISRGTQVVVKNASDETIAVGKLDRGYGNHDKNCEFDFTVSGIPVGERFYNVEVGHRGALQFTEKEMRAVLSFTL